MAEVDKSIKLVFNEFQRSISEVPVEVYYQQLTADQYNSAGFQFNVKSPGTHALLDTDIWIEYNLLVRETANFYIKNLFENTVNGLWIPQVSTFIALRSGYCIQRTIQNFSLQINNQTLNVRPSYYVDVLNRLYISNDQSEHEFSPSGGRFEEGNHGHRVAPVCSNPTYGDGNPFAANVSQATHYSTEADAAFNAAAGNVGAGTATGVVPYIMTKNFWGRGSDNMPLAQGQSALVWAWPEWPDEYEFKNSGLERRVSQLALKLRQKLDTVEAGGTDANAAVGAQYAATNIAGNQGYYIIKIYERLPIPLFKMYSNDEIYGVIPNIVQMQIQGNFVNNMMPMLFRSNSEIDKAAGIDLYWAAPLTTSYCTLYLRWYTAPKSMSIPREISVPYKKIVTWSKTFGVADVAAVTANYVDYDIVSEYNISLEAIPDLLLIYTRCPAGTYKTNIDDDFNYEIRGLTINIDNASGKVNQITSLDLYHKWKRLLKHSDSKIIGYEEWRRYCCVACLQPEDYGVRYGPGYSNPCVLGFKFTPRTWRINPRIGAGTSAYGGGATNRENIGAGITQCEVVVTTIYYKNKLTIRADGTASQEMVKMAADFDMNMPENMMGAAGYGVQNA